MGFYKHDYDNCQLIKKKDEIKSLRSTSRGHWIEVGVVVRARTQQHSAAINHKLARLFGSDQICTPSLCRAIDRLQANAMASTLFIYVLASAFPLCPLHLPLPPFPGVEVPSPLPGNCTPLSSLLLETAFFLPQSTDLLFLSSCGECTDFKSHFSSWNK